MNMDLLQIEQLGAIGGARVFGRRLAQTVDRGDRDLCSYWVGRGEVT